MSEVTKNTAAAVALNLASPEIGESDRLTTEYEAQLTPIPFIQLGIVQEIGSKDDTRKTQLNLIADVASTDQQQIEEVTEFIDSITSARVSKTMQTRTFNVNQYDVPSLVDSDKTYMRLIFSVTRGFITTRESVYIQYISPTKVNAAAVTFIKETLAPMIHFEGADKVKFLKHAFGDMS